MYSSPLERVTGIEPVTRAWKARMLPLHHTRKAIQAGLEPATDCLEGSCSIQLSY
jgi:hypothetical protein